MHIIQNAIKRKKTNSKQFSCALFFNSAWQVGCAKQEFAIVLLCNPLCMFGTCCTTNLGLIQQLPDWIA